MADAAAVLETARLRLRELTLDDADAQFILRLVNDPAWLSCIGDRGVRTLDDARRYIADGPVLSYRQHGFGLYLTELKPGGARIGICGLVKRDGLGDVDVGFAFLPEYRRQGYAVESAAAVLEHARTVLGLDRVVAVTSPDNVGSIKVLEKIGLRYERMVRLPADDEAIALYS